MQLSWHQTPANRWQNEMKSIKKLFTEVLTQGQWKHLDTKEMEAIINALDTLLEYTRDYDMSDAGDILIEPEIISLISRIEQGHVPKSGKEIDTIIKALEIWEGYVNDYPSDGLDVDGVRKLVAKLS